MIRNKEFRYSLYLQIAIVVLLLALINRNYLSGESAITILGVLTIVMQFIVAKYRYDKIRDLEEYVRMFEYRKSSLGVLDNEEGELSILKNTLYKLSMTLLHQKELLQQDKEYLADAISDISHQLKTPITSILVMTDLLDQEELEEAKRKEFLRNILNSVKRMEWLVQSLLKIAKLDAGSIVLKKEAVSITELIEAASKEFRIPMELREISFVAEGDSSISLCCDKAWTVEALSNIIKNCMEHTRPGGTVKVSYEDNAIYTLVTISDTGVGIRKEDLPHIFERFYRGKNASIHSVGIGLALSKTIFMRQKATIDAHSEEGKGATFVIKFYR